LSKGLLPTLIKKSDAKFSKKFMAKRLQATEILSALGKKMEKLVNTKMKMKLDLKKSTLQSK
jgi:hypothetical protein